MWLHDTITSELHYFNAPEDVPGGYTILSHVWSGTGEQTFREVQEIWAEYKKGTKLRLDSEKISEGNDNVRAFPFKASSMIRNAFVSLRHSTIASTSTTALPKDLDPHELMSSKIRHFLDISQAYGYHWAWCDTSCINKESSAELSEAINSMYRYYSLSDICFVYLQDMPVTTSDLDTNKFFHRCKWHSRGWTLQELLAPKLVVFLFQDWTVMGTKTEMACKIAEVTHIPETILMCQQDLSEIDIATRMSWASERQTTRLEDEAYCLMGVFGVNMPTLYGEGGNAFYRLQEEIMKRSNDPSIFTWGTIGKRRHVTRSTGVLIPQVTDESYLFAWSPRCFRDINQRIDLNNSNRYIGDIDHPTGSSTKQMAVASPLVPTFSITPHGILAYARIAEHNGRIHLILPFSPTRSTHPSERQNRPPGLVTFCLYPFLHPVGRAINAATPGGPLQTYYIDTTAGRMTRILDPGSTSNPRPPTHTVESKWRNIYIMGRPRFRADPAPPALIPLTCPDFVWGYQPPFRISSLASREIVNSKFKVHPREGISETWTVKDPVVEIELTHDSESIGLLKHVGVIVALGLCPYGRGAHWAKTKKAHIDWSHLKGVIGTEQPSHSCLDDHIAAWPGLKKTFRWSFNDSKSSRQDIVEVDLRFSRCPLNPHYTFVLKSIALTHR